MVSYLCKFTKLTFNCFSKSFFSCEYTLTSLENIYKVVYLKKERETIIYNHYIYNQVLLPKKRNM